MKALLNPKNIAVVGASRDSQKIGYIIFDNLLSGSRGRVFAVNPNAAEILGQPVYKTILDIQAPIDLAVISLPVDKVVHALESCGKKGVKAAIIITSGFSESGQRGRERENELLHVAKKFKIRLLGPNCLGVINNFTGLNASFATSQLPAKYKVGIFSQSGAMGSAMLDFANGRNFGFSYFVSLGNKSDISEVDLLKNWLTDENVAVGLGYLEDVKNGPEFLKACRDFAAQKPLILLKGGMSKEGSKAARLHTAAMAQDEVVFRAAMKEAGVILAKNLGDLFELAIAFGGGKYPQGRNLAILSNAGGPSVLGADACAFESISLPALSSHTVNQIIKKTSAASVENPVDLRGDASRKDFAVALAALEKDSNVDGILVIVTPQAMTEVKGIAYEIVNFYGKTKKPIYLNFIGGELAGEAIEIASESGVPTFGFPERAVRAFGYQADYNNRLKFKSVPKENHKNHSLVKAFLKFSRNKINQEVLFKILESYGLRMAKTKIVNTPQAAGRALAEINPPAVMKIASPDILHKTDIGGVIMGVTTPEEAEAAYNKILKNASKACPEAKIEGVTVMETAKEGLETIVGAKNDPTFGPVLMFGFGGIFVELVKDFNVILAPFTEEKIKGMIQGTKVSKIIEGYRGKTKYSERALVSALSAVGRLIEEHPEISQIEINPVILNDAGEAVGLDAKIDLFDRH